MAHVADRQRGAETGLGHSAVGFMVERYGEQKMFQFVAGRVVAPVRPAARLAGQGT